MATVESGKGTQKFSGSIGAGVKSLMSSGGRTFFIIEHRSNSAKHRAGETQEIIVNYIELGRGSKYGIAYGEDCKTVSGSSGPHAAIVREGQGYIIKHMGKNPTLVNGRPVNRQWFLQSGDEIQLSVEGPKLGFIVPQQNTVSSIPLSRRLSLFRQQALRPYKQAMRALAAILIIGFSAAGYMIYDQIGTIARIDREKAEMQEQFNRKIKDYEVAVGTLRGDLSKIEKLQKETQKRLQENTLVSTSSPAMLANLFPNVYFIVGKDVTVTYQGQTQTVENYGWTGTGFLTSDGRFITARHVVEPWAFLNQSSSELELTLNVIMNEAGTESVSATLYAYSPNGSSFELSSSNFKFDRSGDETQQITSPDGDVYTISSANFRDGSDWAVVNVNKSGGLDISSEKSNNLEQGERLHILGYPLGLGAESQSNISPLYSNTDVAISGLNNGVIVTSNRNFDHGNSGGPVFYIDSDGSYKVVGIISAGAGDAIGFIIPISAVR